MNFYNLHIINDFNIKKYELLSLNEIKNKKNFLLIKKKICIINEKQSLRTINTLINFLNFFNIKFTIINNKHNFKKENIKDFSKTLGMLYDYVFFRSYNDVVIKLIAKNSGSVLINMLSNNFHPFQSINDIFLIKNNYIYFFGDFNSNVFKSIIINLTKINKYKIIIIFSPKKYWNYIFLKKIFNKKKIILSEKIIFLNKKIILYNDVWFSMGETNFKTKINNLINFQINKKIFKILKIKKIFHCLPSYKKKKKINYSEIEECIFESNFTFFDKQIIEKVNFLKSYLFISNKIFFNYY